MSDDRCECVFVVQDVHVAGLAHCDLKPENIMMMEDGSVKLADFGAAVAINPDTGTTSAVLLFSKLNKLFFGYFDPVNILLDNENQ